MAQGKKDAPASILLRLGFEVRACPAPVVERRLPPVEVLCQDSLVAAAADMLATVLTDRAAAGEEEEHASSSGQNSATAAVAAAVVATAALVNKHSESVQTHRIKA